MNELERLGEVFVSSKEIYDGRIIHLNDDLVTLPNGKGASREVIRHIGAVCVVALTDDNKVIMERQFRYPINEVITEIPAGKLDSKAEDRSEAIKRELREETGYTADEWTYLGEYLPTPAYSDESISMYMAKGLHKGENDLDEDEFLDVYMISIDELVRDIIAGKISDGKTQTAVLKAYYCLNMQ